MTSTKLTLLSFACLIPALFFLRSGFKALVAGHIVGKGFKIERSTNPVTYWWLTLLRIFSGIFLATFSIFALAISFKLP
jgi:hypothetical protein